MRGGVPCERQDAAAPSRPAQTPRLPRQLLMAEVEAIEETDCKRERAIGDAR
jgi:hypothetical protein